MISELSVETALERILAGCAPLDAVEELSGAAAGMVLAEEVRAPHPLPSFANAAMDGFAVRAADIAAASAAQPVVLPVVGTTVQAGHATHATPEPGCALRIMTGAPLPAGVDAVVPLEDVHELPDGRTAFVRPTQVGHHVRPVGEDIAAGAVAVPAGRVLRAAEMGLISALGIAHVRVTRRPRVAIFSTGDELLHPGEPLAPGRIRDANGPALAALVAECGALPMSYGIVRDAQAALRDTIDAALAAGADMLLTSAGASAGDHDIVSGFMRGGDTLEVWRVNIKPGRPLLFGHVGGVPLVGLPGNPAAALIVAEVFVRPAIHRRRGLLTWQRPTVWAVLEESQQRGPRRHYMRARLEWDGHGYHATTRCVGAGSASLSSLVRANGLLIIPEGAGEIEAGSLVEAMLL
jgi:molybdopterin molybdotransferase